MRDVKFCIDYGNRDVILTSPSFDENSGLNIIKFRKEIDIFVFTNLVTVQNCVLNVRNVRNNNYFELRYFRCCFEWKYLKSMLSRISHNFEYFRSKSQKKIVRHVPALMLLYVHSKHSEQEKHFLNKAMFYIDELGEQ